MDRSLSPTRPLALEFRLSPPHAGSPDGAASTVTADLPADLRETLEIVVRNLTTEAQLIRAATGSVVGPVSQSRLARSNRRSNDPHHPLVR